MWDPPRPGLQPMCLALAGRLSTTAPPGKPLSYIYSKIKIIFCSVSHHPYLSFCWIIPISMQTYYFTHLKKSKSKIINCPLGPHPPLQLPHFSASLYSKTLLKVTSICTLYLFSSIFSWTHAKQSFIHCSLKQHLLPCPQSILTLPHSIFGAAACESWKV